jgi:hypothetical protein
MACLTSDYDLYNEDSIPFSFVYITGRKYVMWHQNDIFLFGISRAVLIHVFVCIFNDVDGK